MTDNTTNQKTCPICQRTFTKKSGESRTQWETKKTCSKECRIKRHSIVLRAPEINKRISDRQKGSSNSNWRGGVHRCTSCGKSLKYNVGTLCIKCRQPSNIHAWVGRYKGSPRKCEICGTTESRMYHWANVSGKYTRDLSDWIRLCVPCHSKYDKGRLLG